MMSLTLDSKVKYQTHRQSWHIRFEAIAGSLSRVWKGIRRKKRRYSTTIDNRGCFTLFDLPNRCTNRKVLAIRKLVLQNASKASLMGFRSSELLSPTPATGFYLDQAYPLYWDVAKSFRPDSILQAICQISDISEGTLAITTHPSRQNLARLCGFKVRGLDQDFHLVLPISSILSYVPSLLDPNDEKSSLELPVLLAHMPSWTHSSMHNSDAHRFIRNLFPSDIVSEDVHYLSTCFWAWECVIDELSKDQDYIRYIELCIEVLLDITAPPEGNFIASTELIDEFKLEESKQIILALHQIINTTHIKGKGPDLEIGEKTCNETWKVDFWLEILTTVQALRVEQSFPQQSFSMKEMLEIRLLIISIRPLMVLVRASLGLPTTLNILTSPRLRQIQILTQAVTYLQWDLLHPRSKEDNHTEDLSSTGGHSIQPGISREGAVKETLAAHNDIMRSLLCLLQLEIGMIKDIDNGDAERWENYLAVLVSLCGGMARNFLG